jgi:hypothetical protein
MSKKRKAEGINLEAPGRRSPNASATVPLSAFAAAKAKAKIGTSSYRVAPGLHEEGLDTTEDERKIEASKNITPLKTAKSTKLRRDKSQPSLDSESQITASVRTRKVLQKDDIVEQNLSQRPGGSNGRVLAEQEMDGSTPGQNIRLSSWTPTSTNILSFTPKAEQLRLFYGQTLAILGHYKLKVLDGLVTVSGTFLTSASSEQEILAVSIVAVPPIKCISSSGAEIEISHLPSRRRTFQDLQRLSPLFSNLLNNSNDTDSFVKVFSNTSTVIHLAKCI